jgi:hypothetical protein
LFSCKNNGPNQLAHCYISFQSVRYAKNKAGSLQQHVFIIQLSKADFHSALESYIFAVVRTLAIYYQSTNGESDIT